MKNFGIVLGAWLLMFQLAGAQIPTDFYTGTWAMVIKGTPNGDAKMHVTISRVDTTLTGLMKDTTGQTEVGKVTGIEEKESGIIIYFSAQGYDVSADLKKVDDHNLSGSLINMFDVTATRLMTQDFYAGKWEILFKGTPNGDGTLVTELIRQDGQLTGELKDPSGQAAAIKITRVDEKENGIEIFFTAQGYDVSVVLNKVDNDNLKGSLVNMFDATAKRMK